MEEEGGATDEEVGPQVPTEIVKEIVTEDGTVMTIKEVISVPQDVKEEEEEEEEEDDGRKTCEMKLFQLVSFSGGFFSAASASGPLVEPCPRSSAMATVRQGKLYLYGGMFEVGDRQFTLGDFYCLDLHKMDQWEVLVEMDPSESQGNRKRS